MSAARLDFASVSADELSSMPGLVNPNALRLLECCVCQETIENPRRACENDHYNCLACLEKIEKTSRRTDQACACPTCRGPLIVGKAPDGKVGRPVPAICEVIESQLCTCPHGCGMVGPISKLRQHTADACPKAPQKCPYGHLGCCFEFIPRDEMAQHLKDHEADHQLLMNSEQQKLRQDVEWVGKSAKHDRKKIVEAVVSYKSETNMLINALTNTVRQLSQQNEALMDGFSGMCAMVTKQNALLEAIDKGNASNWRAVHYKGMDKANEAVKSFERKRKAQKETPPHRHTKSRTSPPSAPGAPGPSMHRGSEERSLQSPRDNEHDYVMQALLGSEDDEDEEDSTVPRWWGTRSSRRTGSRDHPNLARVRVPSPGYSPTSPGYSPTSPGYSPTSPAYEPEELDEEVEVEGGLGELA